MSTKEVEKYTKYEKARLIGARALQISLGAPFMVTVDADTLQKIKYNPVEIAKMEFEAGVIPIRIKRRMPEPFKQEELPNMTLVDEENTKSDENV